MNKPCPVCRRPVVETRYRPFCSRRCADIDLGRWLGGDYKIPTEEDGDGDGRDASDADAGGDGD